MHLAPRLRCIHRLNNTSNSSLQLKQIHAQLITNGVKSPSPYAKLIIQISHKSSPQTTTYAHLVFHHHRPNLFLFNTLIRCAPPRHSISIFANWVSIGDLEFDHFTYIFVLGACARAPSLPTLMIGKQIHTQVFKRGVMSNIWVQTTTIHFYASNKDVCTARKVFDEMSVRNSVTWNAMITGYCSQSERVVEKYHYARDALELFRGMLVESTTSEVKPTDTTMVCLLSAASQLGVLETGACVHAYIEKTIHSPENDVFIGSGLVDMYSKCGCLSNASSVFNQMKQRNVLTWTAMATGLAVHGKGKEALELLGAMGANGVKPNAVTFTSLLSACCHGGLVEEGLHLFHVMGRKFGVVPQMQHYGCIVDLLGRSGQLREAYELIMGMPVQPDAVLWRSLLSSCMVHGDVEMGEKVGKFLVQSFDEWCVRSEDFVALSNVYASAERWGDVEAVREEMKIKGIENKAGYSSVQTTGAQGLEVL